MKTGMMDKKRLFRLVFGIQNNFTFVHCIKRNRPAEELLIRDKIKGLVDKAPYFFAK